MHQSICTIDAPEFINLQPLELNPLMSKCEIKVFYLGENRNKSFITKEVATEMAKTLRGAPIVGYYKESKEDFADHGEQVIIDDEGVHFSCNTRPYGFVSPDAKVWFQTFQEEDAFGTPVVRTYLMTTGFLWTGQYPECDSAVQDDGKQHSMELDPKSMKGEWATNDKGIDFFIVSDAVFSKLCILGDDTEPCFEGSKVSAPEVSMNFTMDENFKQTLFSMMQELKLALEGGNQMELEKDLIQEEQDKFEKIENVEIEENTEITESDFVASKKDKDDEEDKKDEKKSDEDSNEKEDSKDDEEDDDKKKKPSSKSELEEESEEPAENYFELYTQLQHDFEELQAQFTVLEEQNKELSAFKFEIESKEKDALISEFFMLDDADKKDVIENKDKYTYDEIKSKLSVICYDKKVSFNLNESEETETVAEEPVVTFDVETSETDSLPAWVKMVKQNQNVTF